MFEPVIVESALNRPHMCATCRGTKGPFLDWIADTGDGRLYSCMLCIRRGAAASGFAKGERMDALVDAKTTVEHAEHEIDERNETIALLRETLTARVREMAGLQSHIEELEGDAKRRDHIAQVIEASAKQLVNGGAA